MTFDENRFDSNSDNGLSTSTKGILGLLSFFGIVLMLLLVLWLVTSAPNLQCRAKAEAIGLPYQYSLATGCMVETSPGHYIPINSYYILGK